MPPEKLFRYTKPIFNNFCASHAVRFYEEPITLRSDRKSHWKADFSRAMGDAGLMDILSTMVISFIDQNQFKPDCIYGVPEGVTPLGLISQYKMVDRLRRSSDNILLPKIASLPMGRGNEKRRGSTEDKYFVTPPKGKTVVLEDVTTTGRSLVKECSNILGLDGVFIIQAISLLDRLEITGDALDIYANIPRDTSVKDALSLLDIPYSSMANAKEVLPLAIEHHRPSRKVIRAIEQECEEYGIEPLKLI